MPTFRNTCAHNPIMRKGGAHSRSKTGKRSRDKYELMDLAADSLEEYYLLHDPGSDFDEPEIKKSEMNKPEMNKPEMNKKGERDAPFSFVVLCLKYNCAGSLYS